MSYVSIRVCGRFFQMCVYSLFRDADYSLFIHHGG